MPTVELGSKSARHDSELNAQFDNCREKLLKALSNQRRADGAWEGKLSDSALSTATAISALSFALSGDSREFEEFIAKGTEQVRRGLAWLAEQQNEDGGWGDTPACYSNISTTMLVLAAVRAARADDSWHGRLQQAERYVREAGGVPGIRARYGRDRTFSVPILANAAMAGLVPWREVAALPFEAALIPQRFYNLLQLPVVSYAIPALVAIGQAKFVCDPPRNPLTRWTRSAARRQGLAVLRRMQPASGGFLEAVPLTSFVAMGLIHADQANHPVVRDCIRFLIASFREHGSWPIDTNLATWNTTLTINAIGHDWPNNWLSRSDWEQTLNWLLDCQNRERHPFTGARPGGWGWSDLSGSVPDADDTAGALLALANLQKHIGSGFKNAQLQEAASTGADWLLRLQNRDGGWPTFCRGWGKLPFDRSGSDLTAHAIRGLLAWRGLIDSSKLSRALARGFKYLNRQQNSDGSWAPLWFGNQDLADQENRWYGTSKVLLAFVEAGQLDSSPAQNGLNWIVRSQSVSGGWGGGPALSRAASELGTSSLEETALCLEALLAAQESIRGRVREELKAPISAGLRWLVRAIEMEEHAISRPIGFYFAKLWYDERLYPQIFALAALNRAKRVGLFV